MAQLLSLQSQWYWGKSWFGIKAQLNWMKLPKFDKNDRLIQLKIVCPWRSRSPVVTVCRFQAQSSSGVEETEFTVFANYLLGCAIESPWCWLSICNSERDFLLKQAHLGEKSESNSRQISNGPHPRMRQMLLVVCELLKFGWEGLVGLKVTPLWVYSLCEVQYYFARTKNAE